jgi:hypothetical protein
MSIQEVKVTRFVATCDDCGRKFAQVPRLSMANADLAGHKCGEHRQAHDSTGGFRGILGGWNVYCVCGVHYVADDPAAPFACPKEVVPHE